MTEICRAFGSVSQNMLDLKKTIDFPCCKADSHIAH